MVINTVSNIRLSHNRYCHGKISQRVIRKNKKIKYNHYTIDQRDMERSPQYGRQINVEEKVRRTLLKHFQILLG
jgi:hypothetical protein